MLKKKQNLIAFAMLRINTVVENKLLAMLAKSQGQDKGVQIQPEFFLT